VTSGGTINITIFYDGQFTYSSNIKIITAIIRNAAAFALPLEGIYDVRR
jgi:hypothetical protein